ncbi:MAG: bifunctional 2',3'-cyclic-nucleotide 2'-phosphodiesterase/3'-nucleotidase [Ruegeria sp.]|uniref:bifunctional 2',3'-cyclic-nucleotide 2'-phosphodiesterase/3'-nucleotidase n=1 Tax=Ruegeria sp. TaxID=1879320 RepID=UPI00349E55DC
MALLSTGGGDASQERDQPAQGTTARLRLLATSDLHMNLLSFDYYADRSEPTVGLTRTASLIRAARAEANASGTSTLLVDNGDSLQGTPLGEWAAEESDVSHPLMQTFDHLGYDAIGLGNHDFNFGLDALDRILTQAPCPVLCSNLLRLRGSTSWRAAAILTRTVAAGEETYQLRIGLFSVLPPQTMEWEAHVLEGQADASDILSAAEQAVHKLRGQGCDLIVALAHTGLDDGTARTNMENAAIPLAYLEGIDAVVAGHTHLLLPGVEHEGLRGVEARHGLVHGKPMVMPGASGSHLGVIDLTLAADGQGGWQITERRAELRPIFERDASGDAIPTTPEDPELTELLAPAHAATRARMGQPVGQIEHPLHSYFSFCAPDRGLALVAAAQAAALRPYLSGRSEAELPLLSATAPSKFGGRAGPRHYTQVPAGQISLRHVADLHVFPNELRARIVTGAQLRDWLEMSAVLFHQLTPGNHGTELVDRDRAGYNFDVLHGAEYKIDLSAPARFHPDGTLTDPAHHRIHDLRLNGTPVTDDQRFVVALNNYRAAGGGHFAALSGADKISIPSLRIQDILRDYLTGRLPSDPLENAPPSWRFSPLQETQAILRTGPGAEHYLDELARYQPELLGMDQDGFLRLGLRL